VTKKRQQIGKKIREVFHEIKQDPPVFFVDSYEYNDIANNNELVAFRTLAMNKPKFDCSGMKVVNPSPNVHIHDWIPVHNTIVNQVDIRTERHHTGNWGGFFNGWSCCGQGKGNTSWNHNDCHPRTIQSNRLICSQCQRAPSTEPCSLKCSCGIVKIR
jgi:hypothetical protein